MLDGNRDRLHPVPGASPSEPASLRSAGSDEFWILYVGNPHWLRLTVIQEATSAARAATPLLATLVAADSGLTTLNDNPTKPCTPRRPLASWDLVPIQPFAAPGFAGNGVPGEDGRGYGNERPGTGLEGPGARTLRALLSPEARSCAVRGTVYPPTRP